MDDIYALYMNELAAIEPCTEAENLRLLREFQTGSRPARERLIEGNLKRALGFVREYLNRGVPMADLIQEASVELTLLVDEGFSGSFEKLLESRVRVRLEEVIYEQQSETEAAREILNRVNALQELSSQMAAELGREATLAELSGRMGVPESEVKSLMKTAMDALKLAEIHKQG
ncbi:MAG: RNA polymerase subunit sigma-70 [Lachnospiraceae bacterium]|nr:RNA polymerase subunit sigma-70 [Lachnospiraceae bacterium]